MSITLGSYTLVLNLLVLPVAVLAAMVAAKFDSRTALRVAKGALVGYAGLVTVAAGVLLYAFISDDFRLDYVGRYSEKALPLGYKIAAFWAGQPGSLLLWAWLLGVMSVITVYTMRSQSIVEVSTVAAVLAIVCAFFVVLMLFTPLGEANPFWPAAEMVEDGHGLNPLLQDPGMIAHPPILFLGYAGFTIPFALMLGALVAGWNAGGAAAPEAGRAPRARAGRGVPVLNYWSGGAMTSAWLRGARVWAAVSWVFLTIGIVLGAQWAYVELGWGGYWAWDPVENASLLPWLTGTALLHSIMAQQHRGMLKIWNTVLVTITYLLCIFGTYITRSGVVSSVHSFGESPIGNFFLVFMLLNVLAAAGVILWRLPLLKTERPLEALMSREGAFLLTNILLVGMMLVTTVGTMFPVLSRMFGESQSVQQSFYNKKVVPMAIVLVALMAIAPLLGYGKDAAGKLVRRLAGPVAVGIFLVLLVAVTGVFHAGNWGATAWALVCALVVAVGVVSIMWDAVRATAERMKTKGEHVVAAALRLVDNNHRRYGGQVVHVGMLMIVAGIAGSSLFNVQKEMSFQPGQSVELGRYVLKFEGYEDTRGSNYVGMAAAVTLTEADGTVKTLKPERRRYQKWERQDMSEVAIESSWREDLYVMFAGHDPATGLTAIKALVNPLVGWIWTGCWVLTAGVVLCLLPRLEPKAWRAAEPEPVRPPVAPPAAKRRPGAAALNAE